jgi:hypothetical protein
VAGRRDHGGGELNGAISHVEGDSHVVGPGQVWLRELGCPALCLSRHSADRAVAHLALPAGTVRALARPSPVSPDAPFLPPALPDVAEPLQGLPALHLQVVALGVEPLAPAHEARETPLPRRATRLRRGAQRAGAIMTGGRVHAVCKSKKWAASTAATLAATAREDHDPRRQGSDLAQRTVAGQRLSSALRASPRSHRYPRREHTGDGGAA